MRISFFDAAQPYVSRGWSVFPTNQDKIPLTPNGLYDATRDLETIKVWSDKFHDANISIAAGGKSGFIVLDVDGPYGVDSYSKIKDKLPPCPVAQSGRGYHLYFKDPGRLHSSKNRLGRGIDIIAKGAAITAPPSIHKSGAEYKWLIPLEVGIPSLPLSLFPAIYRPEVVINVNPVYVCDDIRELADKVISAPEGQRNHTLNAIAYIAGKMIKEGRVTHSEAFQVLYDAARAVGLEKREIKPTIRSGLRAGQRS